MMKKILTAGVCACGVLMAPLCYAQDVAVLTITVKTTVVVPKITLQEALAQEILQDLQQKNDRAAFISASRYGTDAYPDIQGLLGLMYIAGVGTDVSIPQGMALLGRSADLGNARSALLLGEMFESGKYVPKDLKKSFFWYQKAANLNNYIAEKQLSHMYKHGIGCKKDKKLAAYWLNNATLQGNGDD